MRYLYTLVLALVMLTAFAQPKNEFGGKFAFDAKNEQDPHFVLKDNYNLYLLTITDAYDLPSGHQMIVRKFDQKNNLVDVLRQDFPKIDIGTMYRYLGYAESPNGKVAAFVEVHSGRSSRSDICKVEFDKATSKFTTTVLVTNPIPSLMHSGDTYLESSMNGKFVAINYHPYRDKSGPDKNTFILIDAATLNVVWKKDLSFSNEYTSQNYTVTNTGKVVLVRDMKGSKKGITYLTVISDAGQEDKNFDAPIFLNEMKSISIGTDEYIVALNSSSKNFREEYFNSLMLYDLKAGRILNNTKISEISSIRDIYDVSIVNISIQNNEIHVFAEPKVEGPRPTGGNYMSLASLDRGYNFTQPLMLITAMDGQLKTVKKLPAEANLKANLYQPIGLLNIRGTYYVNTGYYSGVYTLDNTKNYDRANTDIMPYNGNPYLHTGDRFINQLFAYFPDRNCMVFAAVLNGTEMSLASCSGVTK